MEGVLKNPGPRLALLRAIGIRVGRGSPDLLPPDDPARAVAAPAGVLAQVGYDQAEKLMNGMLGVSDEENCAPAIDATAARDDQACFAGLRVLGNAGQAGGAGATTERSNPTLAGLRWARKRPLPRDARILSA